MYLITQRIAKLVYNSNNYGWWYLLLQLMGFIKPIYIWGAHIVEDPIWCFGWR